MKNNSEKIAAFRSVGGKCRIKEALKSVWL